MTDVVADLTPDAEARLGDYLREVRTAVGGLPDVNPDEIEADIREHVENELRPFSRPVGRSLLDAVLARLGPPDQWAAGDRPDLLRRAGFLIRERVRGARAVVGGTLQTAWDAAWRGPEDWRLPYLAFGVFAVGVLAFPIFPFCLLVSYVLARAGVALAREKGIELGVARKWLLYPPLVVVSLAVLLGVAVAVPLGVGAGIVAEVERVDRQERWELAGKPKGDSRYSVNRQLAARHPEVQTRLDRVLAPFPGDFEVRRGLAAVFPGAGVFAGWWLVVGVFAVAFPGAVRGVCHPLCDGVRRRHGVQLAVGSLVAVFLWGVAVIEVAAAAGLV